MSVHTIPGWFKVPKNKDSVLTCDIRTFKIIGTFRFHKGFFIVEKVSSEYYYTLKNKCFLALMVSWRIFKIHWNVPLHKRLFIVKKGSENVLHTK